MGECFLHRTTFHSPEELFFSVPPVQVEGSLSLVNLSWGAFVVGGSLFTFKNFKLLGCVLEGCSFVEG